MFTVLVFLNTFFGMVFMNLQFDFNELKITNRLPTPSGTALEIMRLLQRDDVTISAIAELVKRDPALSARILKFVNSASMMTQRSITNINDAIIVTGMTTVRNFALSVSLVTNSGLNRCSGFDYAAYWSLSLARAVALTALSKHNRIIAPEEAFTLGLLADIGRLALATVWSEEYSDCIASARNEQQLKNAEKKCFGVQHDEMSLLLLSDWGFSGLFVDSLAKSFVDNSTNLLAQQLEFSYHLSHYCVASEFERTNLFPNLVDESQKYNFTEEELKSFLDNLLIQWQEWGKIIDVKTDVPYSKLFFLKNLAT